MPDQIAFQNKNEILNNILYLLDQNGLQQKDLADYLGVSRTVITQWKKHQTDTYLKYIDKIAEFLDVSKNDLLNPDISILDESVLTPEEISLIKYYRSLDIPELKKVAMQTMSFLATVKKISN
ncbi:helix-turn-helix domain-containing protein [Megasphaera sp. UBA4233]|uniref:helix-turn-helix domain-containing protein n=1 Tax=Megasphaera sp. UBA4233 TaxID=1946847 RepID=UPI0025BE282F|nr:helix-turn-helix transcriptional regulator [Megasphaera sp. UBA4233]